MISVVIVLTLLSLLVATEPEQVDSHGQPPPEPPSRPARRSNPPTEVPQSDRIAA